MKIGGASLLLSGAAVLAALQGCREQPPAAPASKATGSGAQAAKPKPDARPLDPQAAEAKAIQDKAAAVLLCFHRDMLARQKDPKQARELAAYRRSSFTDLFVFHALFHDGSPVKQETEVLCRSIGERYRAAFVAAAIKRAERSKANPVLASVFLPVDAEPEFVRAVDNPTGLHMLEHAALTRETLLQAGAARGSPIVALAERSSQELDVLRWDDFRFHALTAPNPGNAAASDRATSEEGFVGLMSYQLVSFVLALRDGADARAALLLGIACHMAQDLAWNRGLTRNELSSLQFVVRLDPRRSSNLAARREASRASVRIVQIAREALADKARWARFLAANPTELDFENAMNRVLVQDSQATHLNLGHLTQEWISQLPGRRSAVDVRDPWELEPLYERIARSVQNSGLALGRATGR